MFLLTKNLTGTEGCIFLLGCCRPTSVWAILQSVINSLIHFLSLLKVWALSFRSPQFSISELLTAAVLRRRLVTLIFLSSEVQWAPLISAHWSFICVSLVSSLDSSEDKETRIFAIKGGICKKQSAAQKVWKRWRKGEKLLSDSQTRLYML